MAPPESFRRDSVDLLVADIERSHVLEGLIGEAWSDAVIPAESRAAAGLCSLSLEHGRGLRVLLIEIPPSGIALLRPQYEALVRAAWAHHAARNIDLDRLLSPLTMEGEKAAKKLPGVAKMLAALEKSGATSAAAILGRARSQLWEGLNSFVHCGIHPFQRGESGYPIPLLADLLKNSNGISMLTLVVLAEIANDASVAGFMRQLHVEFGDVLPSLEPLPT